MTDFTEQRCVLVMADLKCTPIILNLLPFHQTLLFKYLDNKFVDSVLFPLVNRDFTLDLGKF